MNDELTQVARSPAKGNRSDGVGISSTLAQQAAKGGYRTRLYTARLGWIGDRKRM